MPLPAPIPRHTGNSAKTDNKTHTMRHQQSRNILKRYMIIKVCMTDSWSARSLLSGGDTENNLLLWPLEPYLDIDGKNAQHCHTEEACGWKYACSNKWLFHRTFFLCQQKGHVISDTFLTPQLVYNLWLAKKKTKKKKTFHPVFSCVLTRWT